MTTTPKAPFSAEAVSAAAEALRKLHGGSMAAAQGEPGALDYAYAALKAAWPHLNIDADGWQRTAEINLDTVTAQHERLVKVEQLLRDALQVLEPEPDEDTSDPFKDARPVVGYCSKCGDVREDFYTCRDGGHTIPKADQSSEQSANAPASAATNQERR